MMETLGAEVNEQATATLLGLPGEAWDWPYVFAYAQGGKDGPYWVLDSNPKPEDGWNAEQKGLPPASGFTLADVERVDRAVPGDNEGPDWVAFGLLRDGRWFAVSAGCDYTGWG